MEIEYSLTEEDHVALSEHLARQPNPCEKRENRVRLMRLILIATLVLLFTFLGIVAQTEPGERVEKLVSLWTVVVAVFLAIGFSWLTVTFGSRKRAARIADMRRHFQEGRNRLYLQKRRMTITPEGLSVTGVFGSSSTPWTMLARIEVTPNHAFLFLTEDETHIVPRRAFATEADFRTFVEAAQQYHARAGLEKFSEARPSSGSNQVSEIKTEYQQGGDSSSLKGDP